jgi:hypothetical protein
VVAELGRGEARAPERPVEPRTLADGRVGLERGLRLLELEEGFAEEEAELVGAVALLVAFEEFLRALRRRVESLRLEGAPGEPGEAPSAYRSSPSIGVEDGLVALLAARTSRSEPRLAEEPAGRGGEVVLAAVDRVAARLGLLAVAGLELALAEAEVHFGPELEFLREASFWNCAEAFSVSSARRARTQAIHALVAPRRGYCARNISASLTTRSCMPFSARPAMKAYCSSASSRQTAGVALAIGPRARGTQSRVRARVATIELPPSVDRGDRAVRLPR